MASTPEIITSGSRGRPTVLIHYPETDWPGEIVLDENGVIALFNIGTPFRSYDVAEEVCHGILALMEYGRERDN